MAITTHFVCRRGRRLWVPSTDASERDRARVLGCTADGVVLAELGVPADPPEPFPFGVPPAFADALPLGDALVLYRRSGPGATGRPLEGTDVARLYSAHTRVPDWTTIRIGDGSRAPKPATNASDEDEVEDVVAAEALGDDDSL